MEHNEIWIKKGDGDARLGRLATYRPQDLAHWTGLKIIRFKVPEEFTDRQVVAPHPIVTLLDAGQTSSRLRYGLRDVTTQCRSDDLMCYSGGCEIDHAHWRTRDAAMISVELDPSRLSLIEAGDTRFTQRTLQGEPRFNDPELAVMLRTLWREVRGGCTKGRLYADSLSLGLAVHVHRRFGRMAAGEDRGEARSRLTAAQLRHLDDYIRTHLDESIGLADLAREVGLSRYHFTRLFTNTVGRSPYQHVLHKRLERAYHLLTSTQAPVADVALAAGFSSQSHFAEVCRRVMGATPKELRDRH